MVYNSCKILKKVTGIFIYLTALSGKVERLTALQL